jgi:putative ABC transport system permease protein
VIASRTVVERRQQVGVLRALGFHPGMVALCFLLESSFIALTGILIGVIAGLLLGDDMVRTFFAQLTPETAVTVPWGQLGVILLLAYGFSLLLTLIPSLQASRIYPAEALRYE